jgi:N-acetylglucosaminyl-diphospho-decaprenol L-rhamnosyltransferase
MESVVGEGHRFDKSVLVVILRLGSHPLSQALDDAIRLLRAECSDISVVVAENADGDPTKDLFEPLLERVIKFPWNVGYAAAINAAVKTAGPTASIVLVMTDDVVLRNGSLSTLVQTCAKTSVGIAAPAVHTGPETWLGGSWHPTWGWARHRVQKANEDPLAAEIITTWVDGACLAIDRVAFDEIGGFDERTFLYGEDLILCLQMKNLGRKIVVVPSVQIGQSSGMTKRSGAHGYLIIRNEILCSQLLNGWPSAFGTAGSSLLRAGAQLIGAFRSSSRRDHYLKQSLGMLWGIIDGVRGRFGPPPAKLAKWATIPNIDRPS